MGGGLYHSELKITMMAMAPAMSLNERFNEEKNVCYNSWYNNDAE